MNSDTQPIHLVPFSHLDLFWTGTREECLSRGNAIISQVLDLMEKHEDFTFLIETVNFLEHYVSCYPAEKPRIREHAASGRLELPPLWSGVYQNLPGGETLARNALLAKRWVRENFGCDPKTAHFGDLPGFTPQYPQIAALSGIKQVLMSRGGPGETPLFLWEGLDGSKVLSFYTLLGYAAFGVGAEWHRDYEAMAAGDTEERIAKLTASTTHPCVVHWGCDLYIPNENLVHNVRRWNQEHRHTLQFSTFERYFTEISTIQDLPSLKGELPSSWPNIESSWPDIWPEDLPCEHALQMAEFLSSYCMLRGWEDYPQNELREAWIALLDGMDHNQNSQGGDTADRDKLQLKKFSRYAAERVTDKMAWRLAAQVPVPGPEAFPVVVFNSMSWRRTGVVFGRAAVFGIPRTSEIGRFQDGLKIVDEAGNTIPYLPLSRQEGLSVTMDIALPVADVPACGFKTYYLVPGENPLDASRTCEVTWDKAVEEDPAVVSRHTSESAVQTGPRRSMGSDVFENRFFRVTVDRVTGDIGIFDKSRGEALLEKMRLSGVEERRGNYIFDMAASGREFPALIDAVELVDNHAVWCRIRISGSLCGMPFRQTLTLFPSSEEIHIENEIDWKGPRWVRMQQVFPYAGPGKTIRSGVPYGQVTYPGTMTGTLGKQGDEIDPGYRDKLRLCLHWVDIGDDASGVTIGCDHRMWEFGGREMRSYMIRGNGYCFGVKRNLDGSLENFHRPPDGTYSFRYVLRPRRASLADSAAYRCGWELNRPLLASAVCGTNSRPTLPASESLLDFTDSSLVVTAVKKAEDGSSVVVRGFESAGRESGSLPAVIDGRAAVETNILEETRSPLVPCRPFEIKTFLFEPVSRGRI